MRKRVRSALVWLRERRRRFIVIGLVIAFFYALGYFTTPGSTPGMCLIYG